MLAMSHSTYIEYTLIDYLHVSLHNIYRDTCMLNVCIYVYILALIDSTQAFGSIEPILNYCCCYCCCNGPVVHNRKTDGKCVMQANSRQHRLVPEHESVCVCVSCRRGSIWLIDNTHWCIIIWSLLYIGQITTYYHQIHFVASVSHASKCLEILLFVSVDDNFSNKSKNGNNNYHMRQHSGPDMHRNMYILRFFLMPEREDSTG